MLVVYKLIILELLRDPRTFRFTNLILALFIGFFLPYNLLIFYIIGLYSYAMMDYFDSPILTFYLMGLLTCVFLLPGSVPIRLCYILCFISGPVCSFLALSFLILFEVDMFGGPLGTISWTYFLILSGLLSITVRLLSLGWCVWYFSLPVWVVIILPISMLIWYLHSIKYVLPRWSKYAICVLFILFFTYLCVGVAYCSEPTASTPGLVSWTSVIQVIN